MHRQKPLRHHAAFARNQHREAEIRPHQPQPQNRTDHPQRRAAKAPPPADIHRLPARRDVIIGALLHAAQTVIDHAPDAGQFHRPVRRRAILPLEPQRQAGHRQFQKLEPLRGRLQRLFHLLKEPHARGAAVEEPHGHGILNPDMPVIARDVLHDVVGRRTQQVFRHLRFMRLYPGLQAVFLEDLDLMRHMLHQRARIHFHHLRAQTAEQDHQIGSRRQHRAFRPARPQPLGRQRHPQVDLGALRLVIGGLRSRDIGEETVTLREGPADHRALVLVRLPKGTATGAKARLTLPHTGGKTAAATETARLTAKARLRRGRAETAATAPRIIRIAAHARGRGAKAACLPAAKAARLLRRTKTARQSAADHRGLVRRRLPLAAARHRCHPARKRTADDRLVLVIAHAAALMPGITTGSRRSPRVPSSDRASRRRNASRWPAPWKTRARVASSSR